MFSFFDKLRRKDKAKQDSFIFFSAFSITLFIFLIWLTTLVYNFGDESSANTASPITLFTNQIKSVFDGTEVYEAEE